MDAGTRDADTPGLDAGEDAGTTPRLDGGGSPLPDNVCVFDVCSEDVDRCTDNPEKTSPGVCGCAVSDMADEDGDGTPDCIDRCPGAPDVLPSGACGCPAAERDDDGDGVANCHDYCPSDDAKVSPGVCGCGLSDADFDGDGMPDCADACTEDPEKVEPGICGCMVSESDLDTDGDGEPDCIDRCSGVNDDAYESDASCGVGYCRSTNTPSTCVDGVETPCTPGTPLSENDATCDGVDDNCNGSADEDYAPSASSCGVGACARTGSLLCVDGTVVDTCVAGTGAPDDATCNGVDDDCDSRTDEDYVATSTSCGVGACARTGQLICSGGTTVNTCTPGSAAANDATCNGVDDDCDGSTDEDYVPTQTSCGQGVCARTGQRICSGGTTVNTCTPGQPNSSVDDATWPGNGLDDDCDGQVDEDSVPPCNAPPQQFSAGAHDISVPNGCTTVTVQLWGAGGGSGGKTSVGETGNPGRGGSGGYAESTLTINGALRVLVGNGGSGCGNGGTNAGASTYNGGNGGGMGATGSPGEDRSVSGGGAGGNGGGGNGGRGHYGGGGGGGGVLLPWPPYPGEGGGGGAASVFLMNGSAVVVAGGGGGGGGANGSSVSSTGGPGGEGCGGVGGSESAGGGGGGGTCVGDTTEGGTNGVPAHSDLLPSGRARGATGACGNGGAGYAIVTFGP